MNKIIIFTTLLLIFTNLWADENAAPVRPVKKVQVNFVNDELVKGANPNPEVEFIFEKANFNYKKLIRLRENFIPEADHGREGFGARE